MSDQAVLTPAGRPVNVLPAPGVAASLITTATLSQSFQATKSTPVSVIDARRCTLLVKHTGHASQVDGYPVILVMLANTLEVPLIGDDSWYPLGIADVSSTDADLGAGVTLITGADYSKGPAWRRVAVGAALFALMPTTGSSETPRQRITMSVDDARWLHIAVIQQGDVTNFGTVAVDYALSL